MRGHPGVRSSWISVRSSLERSLNWVFRGTQVLTPDEIKAPKNIVRWPCFRRVQAPLPQSSWIWTCRWSSTVLSTLGSSRSSQWICPSWWRNSRTSHVCHRSSDFITTYRFRISGTWPARRSFPPGHRAPSAGTPVIQTSPKWTHQWLPSIRDSSETLWQIFTRSLFWNARLRLPLWWTMRCQRTIVS